MSRPGESRQRLNRPGFEAKGSECSSAAAFRKRGRSRPPSSAPAPSAVTIAPNTRAIPGVELFAVADTSAEVRHTAAAQYGVLAVADWRELLGKVDLVQRLLARRHPCRHRARLPQGRRPCAGGKAHRHHHGRSRRTGRAGAPDRPGPHRRPSGALRFRPHRPARPGCAPLEIQCWRHGPWTGRGDDVSRRAGSDDPRSRSGAHAGARARWPT